MTCLGCGRFFLVDLLPTGWPQQNRIGLENFARRRHLLAGLSASANIRQASPLTFTTANWAALADQAPQQVPEQLDAFLVNLSHKSSEPGVETSISTALHRSLAYASSASSFVRRLEMLQTEGWIVIGGARSTGGAAAGYNDMHFWLTLPGWRQVEALAKQLPSGKVGFIAMPFSTRSASKSELSELLDRGIRQGIRKAGFDPKRIDDDPHAEKIDFRILNEIRNARFLVVDTTDSNSNVLFEAGFALGLDKPIIWICKAGHVEQLRFDFRQYNHLQWDCADLETFASKLSEAITFNVRP